MKFTLFIIAAFVVGFLAALPAGPVQIEAARRSINGHLKSAFMVVLGALIVDVLYGAVAFFGIAPFLQKEIVMAVFWLIGGIFLLCLSFVIIRQGSKQHVFNLDGDLFEKKRWGFISGLTLSAVNPMLIFWWLMGQRLFVDVGLIEDFTPEIAAVFLVAGGLGLASYIGLLSIFLYWTKKFISTRKLKLINFLCGLVMLFIGLYFIFISIRVAI
jgi:threonine/homoserine/homoserine lactone efflux protein